jgi:hypothetical protein
MSRTVTKAELAKLRNNGAVVRTVKPAQKKGEPKPDTSMGDALKMITESLSQGQLELAEKLTTVVKSNKDTSNKPMPYRFIIKRDRRGLIESIDAHPIMEAKD